MAELPRTVFLLRHLDGLEVAAIGVRLGIAPEDMERELAHALRVLARGLAEAEASVVPVGAVTDAERLVKVGTTVGIRCGTVSDATDSDIDGAGVNNIDANRFPKSRQNAICRSLFDLVRPTQPHRRVQMTALVAPALCPGALTRARA